MPSCFLQRFSLLAVLIPLDEVRAEWEKTSGPFHKQRVAEHCGIFRDLFKGATFTPWVTLRVEYSQEDEYFVPVYYGNIVTPSEVCEGSWEQPQPHGKPVCFCQMLLTGIVCSGGFLLQGNFLCDEGNMFLGYDKDRALQQDRCLPAGWCLTLQGALQVELDYLVAWLCPVCVASWPCP